MTNKTKLTIITINRNNAEGLERTIRSIISQKFKDFEYIIIDGNSEDHSVKIIKQYKKYIDYWISESDAGIYNAMNKGIKKSNGEYLLFLNSGDSLICDDNILCRVMDDLGKHDLFSYALNVCDDENIINYVKLPPLKLSKKYLIRDTLSHPSTFIKRSLFHIYGLYDESFRISSDYDFFCRCFKKNVSYNSKKLIISNFITDGLSSNSVVESSIENKIIRKRNFIIYYFVDMFNNVIKKIVFKIKKSIRIRTRLKRVRDLYI